MFYVRRGALPPKRHTQFRQPDGSLYAEELFGVEGFTGRNSLLYHVTPPTRVRKIEAAGEVRVEEADDGYHHHRLIATAGLEPRGDVLNGRMPLFFNADVVMGVARPMKAMPEGVFYRNGEADELLFVHEGRGLFDSVFGPLRYKPGDYIVIPIGTTWRLDPDDEPQRLLWLERFSEVEPSKSFRNGYGQLLEHSTYNPRHIRPPDDVARRTQAGRLTI